MTDITQGERILYERLNQYVIEKQIDLLTFWTTSRLCLTLEEFQQLLFAIEFTINNDQYELLQNQKVQFVNLEAIIKNVEAWRVKQNSVANFISRQEKEQKQVPHSRITKNTKYSRMKTTSSYTNSQKHRLKAVKREWQKQSKLNQTLIRAKNESDYQMTIKIGQMNDISKRLKSDSSFIIDSGLGEPKIIEIKLKTGEQIQLSKKIFQKRYEELKLSSLVRNSQVQGTLEEDLKKVLVEVMYLSGQLQEQIKILQQKGVTH